ncbi:MAG: DUF1893 domain-containing protein [Candidatus Bathyarchaeota archaeon]|nr:MAG: DUF1893 domain-containing protein [Candidatus Bathyarchaeota archaeon]
MKSDSHKTIIVNDLEAAKQKLNEKKLSLVIVKSLKSIFETSTSGLAGFLQAIKELNGRLSGSSAADVIVGKAAALLCAYSHIEGVYAHVLSESGLEILDLHNIPVEFEHLVPTILNLKKTDKCPFERLVENIVNPHDAYLTICDSIMQKDCSQDKTRGYAYK